MKIAAIIIVALVTAFAAMLTMQNMKTPTHLGHKNGKLAPMPSKPNAVSTQTTQKDKFVEALDYKGNTAETLAAVKQILAAMGNNDIQTQESHYIYTVFTTPKMHYHDDVEILLDEQAQKVHFRSQSRAGYSDMGVNRQRYESFRALYTK